MLTTWNLRLAEVIKPPHRPGENPSIQPRLNTQQTSISPPAMIEGGAGSEKEGQPSAADPRQQQCEKLIKAELIKHSKKLCYCNKMVKAKPKSRWQSN